MRKGIVGGACLLVLVLVVAAYSMQEAKKSPAAKPPMDEKTAMEMMQKLATPGEGHKKIDTMAGTWTMKQLMWMKPGEKPAESGGTSEFRWVLGGRFMEQKAEGTFMNMPFSGLGYTGYDNYKKKYVSTWMDNFGTAVLQTTGSFDAAGKVLSMSGKMDDFTTGKVVTVREKTTLVSKDEILFEMYGPAPDGKEYRMLEIRYLRKK